MLKNRPLESLEIAHNGLLRYTNDANAGLLVVIFGCARGLGIKFRELLVAYSSFTYLIAVCATQVVLYFCIAALPAYVRQYSAVGVLGEHPEILTAFVVVYFVGAMLLLLRKRIAGGTVPRLWLAAVLSSGVGGAFLYKMLTWLPVNGAYLGWVSANTYVPDPAWNWIRAVAEFGAAATVVAAVLSGTWLVLLQRSLVVSSLEPV